MLLVINCKNIPLSKTLGVTNLLLRLCEALRQENQLIFVFDNLDELRASPNFGAFQDCADDITSATTFEAARGALHNSAIEILPHHFQRKRFCRKSIAICHDFHPFSIQWKYSDGQRRQMRQVLTTADAVVTHFPQTYFGLEAHLGVRIPHIFYAPGSPLLFDTQGVLTEPPAFSNPNRMRTLLYPAQLQTHKNHQALILAAAKLKETAPPFRIICSGSDFDHSFTVSLKAQVERNGLQNEIVFPGRVDDEELLKLYSECDGVIIPSLAEGGAAVAMEAIAAGKPVAIHELLAARSHIATVKGHVHWFDATNLSSTVDALATMLSIDQKTIFERNAEARALISQFSWKQSAALWQPLLCWLAGRGPRPLLRLQPKTLLPSYRSAEHLDMSECNSKVSTA